MNGRAVANALDALSKPRLLTNPEKVRVIEELYQAAYKEGRKDGIEDEKNRLRKIAIRWSKSSYPFTRSLAENIYYMVNLEASSEAQKEAREEYEDPTTTIRRRLEEKKRH